MESIPWWQGATPHPSIREARVNEALFEAKLGEAIRDRGPDEYRLAELFFEKTFLTTGLRQLLLDILITLKGERTANAIVNLKTSFGGGKTHTELAIYHLFEHPDASMKVPQVRQLVQEAGLDAPPACRMAVLPCTRISPTGRKTEEGLQINSLWGEMAYLLGGPDAFALIAEDDARLVSPGEDKLEAVLRSVGPSLILIDETLHYVDKVAQIKGEQSNLAKQTVAFLRELTSVVDALPRNMLIVSLTASRMDQLSDKALDWLERMEHHVNRLARACTPIEGTEIHAVVRRRLFDAVDDTVAKQVASRYHQLYSGLGGLPAQYVDLSYRELIRRSYPFHPELITVLYERWGAKPGFQLTRGTLRFLALTLQDLWRRREQVLADLIQMGHVSVTDSGLRALVRDVSGDAQWESVIGSDVASPAASDQPAKAQIIDDERADGQGLAQILATAILLYSVGGGENPEATRHEVRLSCACHGVEDATWDNLLEKFQRRFFYLYYDDAKYQFRKEPNVTSLHHTYRVNIRDTGEVAAHVNRVMLDKALGINSPSHGFTQVYYAPNRSIDRDDDQLKLVVLGFDRTMEDGAPSEATFQTALGILDRHGQVLRQHRNTVIFCVAERDAARQSQEWAADFLSWRRIQTNPTDWDRIGSAQQALVKIQLEETESTSLQAMINAYSWALIPVEDKAKARLSLKPIPLGTYGPGKLVAPMLWESLTAKTPAAQWLLKDLTPETFLHRYSALAWPESEKWVTTAQLWDRFTSQVGLPILTSEQVLLDTLRQGQYEGALALGLLIDSQSARDQRDSYAQLLHKETLPSNVPLIGERWLVLRPHIYRQIADQPEQVTSDEITSAFLELGGETHPVPMKAVYKIVRSNHRNNIDDMSFQKAIAVAIKAQQLTYRVDGQEAAPAEDGHLTFEGHLVKEQATGLGEKIGRTIVIKGNLRSVDDVAPFFKKVLQPIKSQQPAELTIALEVRAYFDKDPGSGLDAALDDGFDNNTFPGLVREDGK